MADRIPPLPPRPPSGGRSSASRPTAGSRPVAERPEANSHSAPRARASQGKGPRAGAARSTSARPSGTRPGSSRTGPATNSKTGAGQAGPGKTRPALAARPRAAQPVPPSPSTAWVRGAILFAIVVMLAVTLVPSLRSVISQRGDAAALQASIAGQRETMAGLERKAALWKDPDYVEVQARQRLKFVRIGDRAYTVVDPAGAAQQQAPSTSPVVAAPLANDASPWYGKVWQSIQIADRPTAGLAQSK